MRTKTLLLTAALSAAGVASSMAQAVYSVNAVGYVNTTLVPGYNLISNPLDNKATDGNKISNLFAGVPNGTTIYKFVSGVFKLATMDDLEGAIVGEAANLTLKPGEGVFVRLPAGANFTQTFVGEVPQGTLTTDLVPGLQIVSSQVPQAGTAAALGLVGAPGDQVYQYLRTDPDGAGPLQAQTYYISNFDDLENTWAPALRSLDVGEAIFLRKAAAGTWTRTFNVNQ